jgi:UDP-galactopyranose mutase
MAVRVAQALAPGAIVYDCMDQLTNFWYAPPELAERERELLGCADVVFTGGPSLHRAKSMLHPSVHCFPSSVDIDHFATASTADCPSDQWNIPAPRLGFFGVLDERMDFELLGAVAARRPQWHFVMIGPVAKIDPTSLPRQRNIHYLGQRPYRDLPRYIAGWDLCLIPFVIGPATQFISPTKTLEYLAADRPVVSTPIADVADPYGEIVYLARDADGFVAACERALSAPPHLRLVRRARAARVLARTSWDRTVGRMDEILAGLETGVVPTSRSTRDSEWGEEIPA